MKRCIFIFVVIALWSSVVVLWAANGVEDAPSASSPSAAWSLWHSPNDELVGAIVDRLSLANDSADRQRDTASEPLVWSVEEHPWVDDLHPDAAAQIEGYLTAIKADLADDATSFAAEYPNSALLPYQFVGVFEYRATDEWDSLLLYWRWYSGGAHGNWDFKSWNWERGTATEVTLDQILAHFDVDSALMLDRLRPELAAAGADPGLLSRESLRSWSVAPGDRQTDGQRLSLYLWFPPYTLGPFAAGSFVARFGLQTSR